MREYRSCFTIQERSPGAFTMQERAFAEARMRRVPEDVRREVVVLGERRLARTVAGAVGIAGAALLVAVTLTSKDPEGAEPARTLAFAVLAAVLAYLALRAGLRMARPFRSEPALATSSLGRLEPWSVALPLLALALLAPLTIHALVWAVIVLAGSDFPRFALAPAKLSEWVLWSFIIVGHAHLALAAWVVSFAHTLDRSTTEQLFALRAARRGWRHVAFTSVVAAFPGALLLGLPPLIVLVTGAAFVPFAYHLTRAVIVAERAAIGERDARCNDAIGVEDLENARRALRASGYQEV